MFKSNQSTIIRYTWIFIILAIIGVVIIAVTIFPVSALGGVATYASALDGPFGMAFDSDGNLYVANEGNFGGGQTVSKITTGGTTSTFATGFVGAAGIAFNSAGVLHVSDDTDTVYQVSSDGSTLTTFIPPSAGLSNPNAIAFDSDDNLYVLSAGGFLSKFDVNGNLIDLNLAGGFNTPQGLVVDHATGTIYISDWDGVIYQVDKDTGLSTLYVDTFAGYTEGGLAIDSAGNLFLSALGTGEVLQIAASDQAVTVCVDGANGPRGLAFDTSGVMYVTDYNYGIIYQIDGCQSIPTGTVSGTVTKSDGTTPIENMKVGVNFGGGGAATCTDTLGNYTLDAMPLNAPFRLSAGGSHNDCENGEINYLEEYWQETSDWGSAVEISLGDTDPANTTDINFILEVSGTVSGKVTESDGITPIKNMSVGGHFDGWGNGTCTDDNGDYVLSVPLGLSFRVSAGGNNWCGGANNYVQEYWVETPDWGSATPITLESGNPDKAEVNFTLELGGSVSGQVTDGINGIANMQVNAQFDGWGTGTCTDANGNYTISGLPLNQSFRVSARRDNQWCNSGSTNYIEEYYNDTPNWGSATLFKLGNTHPVDTTDIDFTLEIGGTISGTVITDIGQPFVNMKVSAFNDNFGTGACTDSNGDYTMHGVPLDTPLQITAGGLGYNNCGGPNNTVWTHWEQTVFYENATLETLTEGSPNLTGIDFTVELGGTVSGRVTDQNTGLPIANIQVTMGPLFNGVCTDTDGDYTLFGIPLDTPFDVTADGPEDNFCGGPTNYVTEGWQETLGGPGTELTLDSDNRDLTNIDFTLEVGGAVSGWVTDQITGAPISNMTVNVYLDSGSAGTCTDQNGYYVINVALNKDFRVAVFSSGNWCGGARDYIREVWQGTPDWYSATLIRLYNITPDTTDISFTLEKGGTVSGRVTDQITEEGIPNMRIDAYVEGITSTWNACTDENGDYTTGAMPYNTAIKVSASRDNNFCGGSNDYTEEYYDGTDGTNDAALAPPVTIPVDGDILGIDIPLGDSDGIDPVVEDGAPNNGDGNNDGTPDSQQDDVASLPNAVDGEYVTLDADGSTLTNVETTTNPSGDPLPPSVEAPVGFFSFDVENVDPTGIMVTMYVPEGTIVDSYYKFGQTSDNPTDHWYEFLYDDTTKTGAQIVTDVNNNIIIYLYLVDGQRGDNDLAENGSIKDPGMPVIINAAALLVDIMPGDSQTCYNRDGHGSIPVAILGTASFDVHQIIPETVTLDSMSVRLRGKNDNPQASYEDVNGDGLIDLLVHIEDDGLVQEGNTVGVVNGLTYNGFHIRGFDEVCIGQ